MGKPDALSRREDHKLKDENDNRELVVLRPEVFKIRATEITAPASVAILERIRTSPK